MEDGKLLPPELLLKKYAQDDLFRVWADMKFGKLRLPALAHRQNDALAKKILDEYNIEKEMRDRQLQEKIMATKETLPEFYNMNKVAIDKLNLKVIDTTLFVPYIRFLNENRKNF